VTRTARAPLPLWLALVLGAGGGIVYDAGFPDLNLWPLAFLGIAMMLVALIGRGVGGALLVGFVSGLTFYLVHVAWTSEYLGPVPWIALTVFESLFVMLGGLLIALAYRWMPRVWSGAAGRLGLLPVAIAGLWTARETATGHWPYGGFAWGRAVLSQSESPFAHLVAWLGFTGVTFAMVWLVALVIECVRVRGVARVTRVCVAVGAVAGVLALPAWPTTANGQLRVGAVQGNGPAGYFQRSSPGDVLNAQTAATLPLVGKRLDVVVWPEGSVDIDPTRYAESASVLDYLEGRLNAPLVVGAATERGGAYYNSSLLWGDGVAQQYDKKHLVPFGEYVPDRTLWRTFAPDLIDLLQRDETPGTRPNVFQLDGVRAGISICFDIVDDGLLRDMVNGGAQVIFAQTNNADFGQTKENVQQLAIARLRAIESGRALVNISTVGTSQMIAPDGSTIVALRAYRSGAMTATLPLSTSVTPAVVLGGGLEILVCGVGLGLLTASGYGVRGRMKRV
jgi:apolipoprotein N-acyltransferase